MPTVAVLGYYGQGNFGDDLLLQGLRKLFDGWKMQVYSTVSGGSYPLFDLAAVNKCDLFVLGGGELIYRNQIAMPTPCRFKFNNHSLPYKLYNRTFLAHIPYLKHIKIPKIALGCGVNTENTGLAKNARLAKNVIDDLASFNYIGCRDNVAAHMLRMVPKLQFKVDLFFDLAFALDIKAKAKPGDYAVVIPTGCPNTWAVKRSVYWLRHCLEKHGDVWYIPFGSKDSDDYLTARFLSASSLHDRASSFLMPSDVTLQSVADLLGGCQTAYVYRLHGLILSFMLGVPYQIFPYHRKLYRVHDAVTGLSVAEIKARQQESFKKALEATL